MDEKWFLYILQCCDDSYYTGIAKDVHKRLEVHNTGKGAKYTRARQPSELIYFEEHPNQKTAMRREIEIKKWTRPRKDKLVAEFSIKALHDILKVS